MRSTNSKPASSRVHKAKKRNKGNSRRPCEEQGRREVEAAFLRASLQAAAWAVEQGLPALEGYPREVQAAELVRAIVAEDVERWTWAVTLNLRLLGSARPEHALSALRDIAAAEQAAADFMAERHVDFWRQMAQEIPGQGFRDVLATRWREVRGQCTEDDRVVLERFLQHSDPDVRAFAVRSASACTLTETSDLSCCNVP